MINLKEYYLKNCDENYYHFKYYDEIKNGYNIETDFFWVEYFKKELIFFDVNEIVDNFKVSLYPDSTNIGLDFPKFKSQEHLENWLKEMCNDIIKQDNEDNHGGNRLGYTAIATVLMA